MEVKIIPTGGLCNRLRAIATGVAVAKAIIVLLLFTGITA